MLVPQDKVFFWTNKTYCKSRTNEVCSRVSSWASVYVRSSTKCENKPN